MLSFARRLRAVVSIPGALPGRSHLLQLIGCSLVMACAALMPGSARCDQFVQIDYNLQDPTQRSRNTVFLELFDDKPLTRDNFMLYVNGNDYNFSIMHRLSRNFVFQGGGYYPHLITGPVNQLQYLDPTFTVGLNGPGTSNPTVQGEYNQGAIRPNLRGTVSMALSTGPNSGSNQWFVNLVNSTFLDSPSSGGPFTVFAQVAGDGMNLFDSYNTGLSIRNLNPDANDDGTRESGPFWSSTCTSSVTCSDGTPVGGTSLLQIQSARRIDYLGASLSGASQVTNVPANGLAFDQRDAFIDNGEVFTGTGPLTIGIGRTLGIREGFLLNRELRNHGTLAPGLSLGSITVQTDYRQYFDGQLNIQLGGTTADTLYDRVVATGNAFLDGKLRVSLISSFVPTAGNSFTVLTAGLITGNFSSVDLPQLTTPGLVWNVGRTATAYTLSVVAADYNHDGVVNAADYVWWRKNDGTPAGYNTWRANFGNISGGTIGAGAGAGDLSGFNVPEPSVALLVLSGSFILGASRRRRPVYSSRSAT